MKNPSPAGCGFGRARAQSQYQVRGSFLGTYGEGAKRRGIALGFGVWV